MEYVPGTADVKHGDLVVTSGIDGIYPKGFVIGTVESVERGPGTFHEITRAAGRGLLATRRGAGRADAGRWPRGGGGKGRAVKLAATLAALAVALALQTTLTTYVRDTAALDFVLIVVVYLSLTSGPVTGVVAGSVAGLIQDALSSGVLGIGALAKTLVGFAAGRLGTQFIVTAPLPRFVVFIGATRPARGGVHGAVHAAGFAANSPPLTPPWPDRPWERGGRRGRFPGAGVVSRIPGPPPDAPTASALMQIG